MIFNFIFLFCYIGWATAELHRTLGYLDRYRGIKLILVWSFIFFTWPATLAMLVYSIRECMAEDE
ncbi:hypothetical protein Xentx_01554 [Xenorhabdus thuongxuanensis]|uniref:Uncharacterized protein n=2 Tax=Xenorhabdus TaxID=626 RepID=A0A2D0IRU3_9GAMM|nr:hypothetical protein Xentx_01554 [Xenorhabdus thuongxuanensis]PHM24616.1 hypothetical protein Xehl_01866 [Xenorhabdus ehlersii]RKE91255.1 hypothetical protein BDE27_1465 [Xenorhabdus ehlersii]